jgi:hypothetical protein
MLEVLSVVVRGMLKCSIDLFVTRRKGGKSQIEILSGHWRETGWRNIPLENPRNIFSFQVYSVFEKEHERVNVHRC